VDFRLPFDHLDETRQQMGSGMGYPVQNPLNPPDLVKTGLSEPVKGVPIQEFAISCMISCASAGPVGGCNHLVGECGVGA